MKRSLSSISSSEPNTEPKMGVGTLGLRTLNNYRERDSVGVLEQENCWDFSLVPFRTLRVYIPKYSNERETVSDWVHFKLLKKDRGEYKVHQLVILSLYETRQLLSSMERINKDSHTQFECIKGDTNYGTDIQDFPQSHSPSNFPTLEEDREKGIKFWDICESPRRFVGASLKVYDNTDYSKTYIQLKLYTRNDTHDQFIRKGALSLRVGELEELIRHDSQLMEAVVRESLRKYKMWKKNSTFTFRV